MGKANKLRVRAQRLWGKWIQLSTPCEPSGGGKGGNWQSATDSGLRKDERWEERWPNDWGHSCRRRDWGKIGLPASRPPYVFFVRRPSPSYGSAGTIGRGWAPGWSGPRMRAHVFESGPLRGWVGRVGVHARAVPTTQGSMLAT